MRILDQSEPFARALVAARGLRLHHGLVLTGLRGTGKSSAAVEIAKALLCESSDVDAACGACAVCRKVETGAHPDLHLLSIAEDSRDIKVEQVRAIQITLERCPFEGRARVVILDPADRLTEQAQNALLKTLEEPGANTFLLLPTSRPESLLPTVRSRTTRLRLQPVSFETALEALAAREVGDPESRRVAAARSAGSLGLALDLIVGDVESMQQHLVVLLSRPNDISAIALARELLAGTGDRRGADRQARLVLACLSEALRETLHARLALPAGPSYLADAYYPWAAIFESLFDAEADLDLRIPPEQVLTHVLLALQRELPRVGHSERRPG